MAKGTIDQNLSGPLLSQINGECSLTIKGELVNEINFPFAGYATI